MPLITINGVAIPTITSYKLEMADLDSDNSTRSESGDLNRDVIRLDIATIAFSCSLTGAELDTVVAAMAADEFPVTFRAPVQGGYKTATMYAGNRSINLLTDTPQERWEFSVSLVEY